MTLSGGEEMNKIQIEQSKTADTRTCDVSTVSREVLLASSKQHIEDVRKGLEWFRFRLDIAGIEHDWTKLKQIDQFYEDFKTSFKRTKWWDNHRKQERHHLSSPDGIRADVDLIDVIEYLVDGVMAGLARSGKYRKEEMPTGLLELAFDNTVKKLVESIEVRG
jgi:hypothetical protein